MRPLIWIWIVCMAIAQAGLASARTAAKPRTKKPAAAALVLDGKPVAIEDGGKLNRWGNDAPIRTPAKKLSRSASISTVEVCAGPRCVLRIQINGS